MSIGPARARGRLLMRVHDCRCPSAAFSMLACVWHASTRTCDHVYPCVLVWVVGWCGGGGGRCGGGYGCGYGRVGVWVCGCGCRRAWRGVRKAQVSRKRARRRSCRLCFLHTQSCTHVHVCRHMNTQRTCTQHTQYICTCACECACTFTYTCSVSASLGLGVPSLQVYVQKLGLCVSWLVCILVLPLHCLRRGTLRGVLPC